MPKKIEGREINIIGLMVLYALGFYWIALTVREYVLEQYGQGTALLLGVGILLLIAHQFKVRKPYWINGG